MSGRQRPSRRLETNACRAVGDMKVSAHIREHYGLSLGTYGRPRMTMELKEAGLDVGWRRVGRLMNINGIKPVRTHRHKVTTNSNHNLGIAANVLDGNFTADALNAKSFWAFASQLPFRQRGWRHQLCLDSARLALSRRDP